MDRIDKNEHQELSTFFKDDIKWITPQYTLNTYLSPDGKKMRPWKEVNPHGLNGGPLSKVDDIKDVEEYEGWPDIKYLNFSTCIEEIRNTGDYYLLSGFWSPFYHDLTYLFGSENLLVKMCIQPDVVHSALNKLCNFYLEANELFYAQAGYLIDGFFFGNDFGTQNNLLFSPDQFEEFFLPWIKKFSKQAHDHGYQSILHCCGAINNIIPLLAKSGVDCIHPLQVKARDMQAEKLAKYKNIISFMGGVDTQDLLPNGSPSEVADAVFNLMAHLGPNLIVGPSHEALLPDIPLENVKAMCDTVHEKK